MPVDSPYIESLNCLLPKPMEQECKSKSNFYFHEIYIKYFGKTQERNILITNKAIYNLKKKGK